MERNHDGAMVPSVSDRHAIHVEIKQPIGGGNWHRHVVKRYGETALFALLEHRAIRVEILQRGGTAKLEWHAEMNHVGVTELFVWREQVAINVAMKQ